MLLDTISWDSWDGQGALGFQCRAEYFTTSTQVWMLLKCLSFHSHFISDCFAYPAKPPTSTASILHSDHIKLFTFSMCHAVPSLQGFTFAAFSSWDTPPSTSLTPPTYLTCSSHLSLNWNVTSSRKPPLTSPGWVKFSRNTSELPLSQHLTQVHLTTQPWAPRDRDGVMGPQAMEHLEPPKAGRGKEGTCPGGSRGSRVPIRLRFQPGNTHFRLPASRSKRINFCCLKPPRLRQFVTIALGN